MCTESYGATTRYYVQRTCEGKLKQLAEHRARIQQEAIDEEMKPRWWRRTPKTRDEAEVRIINRGFFPPWSFGWNAEALCRKLLALCGDDYDAEIFLTASDAETLKSWGIEI